MIRLIVCLILLIFGIGSTAPGNVEGNEGRMSYKGKLKPKQRVQMTALAVRQGLEGRRNACTGEAVYVFNLNPNYVRVLRDGYKRSEMYHVDLWEPETREIRSPSQ